MREKQLTSKSKIINMGKKANCLIEEKKGD